MKVLTVQKKEVLDEVRRNGFCEPDITKSDEELILHERLLLRANELLKELNYNNDETILNELYQIIHILTLEGYKFN